MSYFLKQKKENKPISKFINLFLKFPKNLFLIGFLLSFSYWQFAGQIPVLAAEEILTIDLFGINFGQVDLNQFSLPLITVLIAAVDGFNPCAMWVLLFLISLLLEIPEKWKRWYLGTLFLLVSGLVNYVFLVAWLEINSFIGLIPWTRLIIALTAWVAGYLAIKSYFSQKQDSGCVVEKTEEKRRVFSRLQKIVQKQSIWLSSFGIILLAFSVNLFELLCSAVLPATYTNILANQEVFGLARYGYLLFYLIIFLLDDILLFVIAMFTLHLTGLTTKYNRLSKLISGILMLLLALWITLDAWRVLLGS